MVHATDMMSTADAAVVIGARDLLVWEVPLFEEGFSDLHDLGFHENSFLDGWDLTLSAEPFSFEKKMCSSEYPVKQIMQHEDFSSLMWDTASSSCGSGEWTAPSSPGWDDFGSDVSSDFNFPLVGFENSCSSSVAESVCGGESRKRKLKEDVDLTPALKMVCKKSIARRTRDRALALASARPEDVEIQNPENKRQTHNVLERRRRNELKGSYQVLREQIPDLEQNDKTPTGVILNRACEYIADLKDMELRLLQELAVVRNENLRLRQSHCFA